MRFSGHDTFHCRHFWIKKGFDLVKESKPFTDSAVTDLGVGRNMVNSIKHWLRSFYILDSADSPTLFAEKILSDDGFDPYLEDEGTLWLLHYYLNKNQYSSIYNLIFGEFRKERPEFTKEHFKAFVNRKEDNVNQSTLEKDFSVFVRTYVMSKRNAKSDIEDIYSGLLTDLNLVVELSKKDQKSNPYYAIEVSERNELPPQVLLYCILENERYGDSITLNNLLATAQDVGSIFAISKDGLQTKIEQLTELSKDIVFTDDAGIKQIQFKKKIDPLKVLENYYAN